MTLDALTGSLATLTHGWTADHSPSDVSSSSDPVLLTDARSALARSLQLGLSPSRTEPSAIVNGAPGAPSPAAGEVTRTPEPAVDLFGFIPRVQLRPIYTQVDDVVSAIAAKVAAEPAISEVAYISSSPSDVPDWANGMRVARTLGPFTDAAGQQQWVNTVKLVALQQVSFSGSTPVQLSVPVDSGIPPGKTTRLRPGSLWIASSLLSPGLAANRFTGLRITGGTITFTVAPTVNGKTWIVSPGASCTLACDLEQAATALGSGNIGKDAVQAQSIMPAKFQLTIAGNSATWQAVTPSQLKAYGSTVALTWSPNVPAKYLHALRSVLVPMQPAQGTFSFGGSSSGVFSPSGQAPVLQAAWALPVAAADATHLGEAAGVGTLALQLGNGTSAHWYTHDQPTTLDTFWLLTSPGVLALSATSQKTLQTTLPLWQNGTSRFHSSVDLLYGPGTLLAFAASADKEELTVTCEVKVNSDRPVRVDGSRLPYAACPGVLLRLLTPSSDTVSIGGGTAATPAAALAAIQNGLQFHSVALENMLLSVSAPVIFTLIGRLQEGSLQAATLVLCLLQRWALPTLPDPYAANFDLDGAALDQQSPASLFILLHWNGGTTQPVINLVAQPTLADLLAPEAASTTVGTLQFGNQPGTVAQATGATLSTTSLGARLQVLSPDATAAMFSSGTASSHSGLLRALVGRVNFTTLLDLSGNASQFGVGFFSQTPGGNRLAGVPDAADVPGQTAALTGYDGLRVTVNERYVFSFALPQSSWEAVYTPGSGLIRPSPASDGFPLLMQAYDEQKLVPLIPLPVLSRQIQLVAKEHSAFEGLFSLPFGLDAYVQEPSNGGSNFVARGGTFDFIQPEFSAQGMLGMHQIRLRPENTSGFHGISYTDPTASTSGGDPGSFGLSILGQSILDGSQGIGGIYNDEFSQNPATRRVPITGIDLAGLGASMLSEWNDASGAGSAIEKVHLQTFVGRTAHDLVQAASDLYPYCARVVRTITMQRATDGWVNRSDTGWVASSNGRFRLPNDPQAEQRAQTGLISGAYNITRIRETGKVLTLNKFNGADYTFTQVLFDADLGFLPGITLQGGRGAIDDDKTTPILLAPARDLVGYIQLTPVKAPLVPAQLKEFFKKAGTFQPAIQISAQLGNSPGKQDGTALRCTGIRIGVITQAADASPVPALGVSLLASPRLPGDGNWSLGKRPAGAGSPQPLPPTTSLPIVQKKGDPSRWHFAELEDVLQLDDPVATAYSFVQNTGAQKLLFERPRIGNPVALGELPHIELPAGLASRLADMAALLGASGLFPDISKAKALLDPANVKEKLISSVDGLKYSKIFTYEPDAPELPLLPPTPLKVALQYKGTRPDKSTGPTQIKIDLDPLVQPRWSIEINALTFAATVPLLSDEPLVSVLGNFHASESEHAHLVNLDVKLGSLLSVLEAIFSRLEFLARFLPGGGGAGLKVALSGTRLSVSEEFIIPQLPLGLGEIDDVSLNMGVDVELSPPSADLLVAVGTEKHPFHWIVSPLAGTGRIALGVSGGAYKIEFQAGLGLGLAIDVGIASGSASVTLAFDLTVQANTITLVILLTGQASVDVLDGLASASLTLTAGMGVTVSPPPIPQLSLDPAYVDFPAETITLLATVAVGIHISICWVVDVDWDGSWKFQQSIHTPELKLSA